jgi:hypothetical protein
MRLNAISINTITPKFGADGAGMELKTILHDSRVLVLVENPTAREIKIALGKDGKKIPKKHYNWQL